MPISSGTSVGAPGVSSRKKRSGVSAATPGFQPIANQLCQAQDRIALCRRAEPKLVRDTLLIKSEDIRERRPTIEERDREIVCVPRRQATQRAELRIGECGERAAQKFDLRANAISDLRKPRSIEDGPGTMAVIPSQQPQSFSWRRPLSATSEFKGEKAALGKIRIVLEPRDLEPIHGQEPIRQATRLRADPGVEKP